MVGFALSAPDQSAIIQQLLQRLVDRAVGCWHELLELLARESVLLRVRKDLEDLLLCPLRGVVRSVGVGVVTAAVVVRP